MASTEGVHDIESRWLGPASIMQMIIDAKKRKTSDPNAVVMEIESEMNRYRHLFAEKKDCDLYS